MSITDSRINRLRRAIFAACRRRGLDDDTRREIQQRAVGKSSLTDMTADDMRLVLDALNGRGNSRTVAHAQRAAPNKPSGILPDGGHTSKLRALWISAYWLGVVHDRSDEALASWICRQTGYGAARWVTMVDSSRLVDALKGWLERDGGVDWSPYPQPKGRPKRVPGARILEALWRQLHDAGEIPSGSTDTLHAWVCGFRRGPERYDQLNHSVHNQLIRALGQWLKHPTAPK